MGRSGGRGEATGGVFLLRDRDALGFEHGDETVWAGEVACADDDDGFLVAVEELEDAGEPCLVAVVDETLAEGGEVFEAVAEETVEGGCVAFVPCVGEERDARGGGLGVGDGVA